jgi:hypothetical protein
MGRIERGSGTRDLLFDSEGSLKLRLICGMTSLLSWMRYGFRFIFSLYRVGDVTYFIVGSYSIPYPERHDGRGA